MASPNYQQQEFASSPLGICYGPRSGRMLSPHGLPRSPPTLSPAQQQEFENAFGTSIAPRSGKMLSPHGLPRAPMPRSPASMSDGMSIRSHRFDPLSPIPSAYTSPTFVTDIQLLPLNPRTRRTKRPRASSYEAHSPSQRASKRSGFARLGRSIGSCFSSSPDYERVDDPSKPNRRMSVKKVGEAVHWTEI
ncbi:hypothetical protein K432DRAFT_379437 [Lepidopterella palustris CBS 459.81]|uniref:Uncharacterized protein n=1 Tax=Lepidopterella palustris CBS 459.81 TaxID=1314670 RepID=A0A8E2EGR6_9PEZI|nr:hypothetical protein K432DRAFT_379437 [Lepidopterella palustris CBS 459.81]